MGRRKFIAARLATQMFSYWLEEALLRGIIRPPRARFDFYQARSAWSRAEWIGAGRMAIDGLKEVQESVMRIEAGLSTYEKEPGADGRGLSGHFPPAGQGNLQSGKKPDSHVRCG
ncbi:hypothetical protein F8Z70_09290 [Escherichia coli]|nr:hypothetical protein F8Z70_09290 [Escherichia coli]